MFVFANLNTNGMCTHKRSADEVHKMFPFVETVPSYDFFDCAGTNPCSQAVSSVGGCIGKGRATKEAVLTLDKGVDHPVVGVFD